MIKHSPNTIDGHLQVDPTPCAVCCSVTKAKKLKPDSTFILSSSSSIVCMSVRLRLMAAEAKVMETKDGLGINSALTSSFRILSHAKRWSVYWAEGDADNYSLTLSHHWRLALQTD